MLILKWTTSRSIRLICGISRSSSSWARTRWWQAWIWLCPPWRNAKSHSSFSSPTTTVVVAAVSQECHETRLVKHIFITRNNVTFLKHQNSSYKHDQFINIFIVNNYKKQNQIMLKYIKIWKRCIRFWPLIKHFCWTTFLNWISFVWDRGDLVHWGERLWRISSVTRGATKKVDTATNFTNLQLSERS